jgi:hypothetical protein
MGKSREDQETDREVKGDVRREREAETRPSTSSNHNKLFAHIEWLFGERSPASTNNNHD